MYIVVGYVVDLMDGHVAHGQEHHVHVQPGGRIRECHGTVVG